MWKSFNKCNFYEHIEKITKLGVGEIFLNSIDNDGLMKGYDLKIGKIVSEKYSVPLIVSGGAGNFKDLINLFAETKASAAACSSLFHFNDYNPIQIRSYLNNNGVKMRKLNKLIFMKIKNYSKPFIIGEVGINHNGSVDLAKKIILLAKESNFDAVKLQKRDLDICIPDSHKSKIRETPWGEMTYLNYKKKLSLMKSNSKK